MPLPKRTQATFCWFRAPKNYEIQITLFISWERTLQPLDVLSVKKKKCNDLQGHAANYESETVAEISRSARDCCSKFLHSSPLIMNFSLGNQWMQNTDMSTSKLSLQTSTWLWCSLYFVFSFLSTCFKTFSIILVLIILRVRRDSQYCKVTHQFSSTARFNA